MAAENFSLRIQQIYRVVLGATIGFLPFVMFFLVREAEIDLLPAVILWLLTFWVIISEWWSIEDITGYYMINSTAVSIISMIYLVALTMLPVSLILGLDKANILQPYVISIVGMGKYNNLQPYVIVFIMLSLIDIPLQFILRKTQPESDDKSFVGNIVFDIIFIIMYGGLLFFVMPRLSNIESVITLTAFYFGEFSLDRWIGPQLFPQYFGEEEENDG